MEQEERNLSLITRDYLLTTLQEPQSDEATEHMTDHLGYACLFIGRRKLWDWVSAPRGRNRTDTILDYNTLAKKPIDTVNGFDSGGSLIAGKYY